MDDVYKTKLINGLNDVKSRNYFTLLKELSDNFSTVIYIDSLVPYKPNQNKFAFTIYTKEKDYWFCFNNYNEFINKFITKNLSICDLRRKIVAAF